MQIMNITFKNRKQNGFEEVYLVDKDGKYEGIIGLFRIDINKKSLIMQGFFVIVPGFRYVLFHSICSSLRSF